MDQQEKQRIADALTAKGAILPCPRCGHVQFSIERYSAVILTDDRNAQGLLPDANSILTVCTNCKYVALHLMNVMD